jgi:hypothetical protein
VKAYIVLRSKLMKKAELKGRVFHAGIIAAVVVVLTGLGACDGFVLDESAKQDAAWEQGVVDENGLVAVRVGLPRPSRSVSDDLVQAYVDYYEVIFKKHGAADPGPDDYFTGTAVAGKEYLSVEVEPGEEYDVLLLAGREANRVLLATGFVNSVDGNGTTIYDSSGQGVPITADGANVISFTIYKANIMVGTGEDLDVTAGGTYERDSSTDNIATIEVGKNPSDDLEIEFNGSIKLADLVKAAKPGIPAFAANTLTLKPLYPKYPLAVIEVPGNASDATGVKFTYEIASTNLPQNDDIDGMLVWELAYYAFGDEDSKSSRWNIRNGIDYEIDKEDSGGSIRLRIGEGSKNYPTVPVNTGF